MLMESSSEDIFIIQEHRLPARDIPEASAWALKRGWKSLWSPAVEGTPGDRRTTHGGVAIMVRKWLGLTVPPQYGQPRGEWAIDL